MEFAKDRPCVRLSRFQLSKYVSRHTKERCLYLLDAKFCDPEFMDSPPDECV